MATCSRVRQPLFGREAEENQLRELVHGVAGGVDRAVLVEGEPGIGKTSLVTAGTRRRPGRPEQVAELIAWLASPQNSMTTGQVHLHRRGTDATIRHDSTW